MTHRKIFGRATAIEKAMEKISNGMRIEILALPIIKWPVVQ